MSTLNAMFATTENNEATTGTRGLAGTAQLTAMSSELANHAMQVINDCYDDYAELVATSKFDNNAMDKLLNMTISEELESVDISFLEALSEVTTTGMLKSQQSKRSRSKSKTMTLDNYKSMMTAAIAENLIRLATGKDKASAGSRRLSGTVEYTEDQLATYAADQELLKKELRNVQSKKSIMKSKADFDSSDDRWEALLKAELQLKERRVTSGATQIVQVDDTKDALTELLESVDVDHLKAGDSKELLAAIKSMIYNTDADEVITPQDIVDTDGI